MESLDNFRKFLTDEGQQPSTVHTNFKLIRKILRECSPLTVESFQLFINKMIEDGMSASYIKQYIIVVHLWGQFRKITELTEYPYPKKALKLLRRQQNFIRALMTDEQCEALIDVPNPFPEGSFLWKRHEMWSVFWGIDVYHGNRPGEAIKLRKFPIPKEPSYVDFARNLIVFKGKAGIREVPLSFVVRDRIKNYMDNYMEGEYLFPPIYKSRGMKYMTQQAWQQDFKKRINVMEEKFPGISLIPNLDPYSIRHTAGTRWDEENWSLRKIQKALGHEKIETTAKYTHANIKGVREMIDNDRLTLPYKSGVEILSNIISSLRTSEGRYINKVFMNIIKKDKFGKKYHITLEAID